MWGLFVIGVARVLTVIGVARLLTVIGVARVLTVIGVARVLTENHWGCVIKETVTWPNLERTPRELVVKFKGL